MENWNNLNTLIDMNTKGARLKEKEAQTLIELCQNGDKAGVKKMLKEGASINCFADNSTPLMTCVENDQYDLAVYLLSASASISFKLQEESEDAFWYALKNKKHQFLDLFILNRCILTTDFASNHPALIYATVASDLKAVESILSHYRIQVNVRDGEGNTALHHNVSKESPTQDDLDIGRLLIAAGADTNARNLSGKTPEEAVTDFAARAMLLASKLEKNLETKESAEPELVDGVEVAPPVVKKRVKI